MLCLKLIPADFLIQASFVLCWVASRFTFWLLDSCLLAAPVHKLVSIQMNCLIDPLLTVLQTIFKISKKNVGLSWRHFWNPTDNTKSGGKYEEVVGVVNVGRYKFVNFHHSLLNFKVKALTIPKLRVNLESTRIVLLFISSKKKKCAEGFFTSGSVR